MTYSEAITVRKRQLAGQPVDKDELAMANRVVAHRRSMARVFGNDSGETYATWMPYQVGQASAHRPDQARVSGETKASS